ncbi:hypothetical protein OUZ56_030625 [Daphnia magna]|uniref:G-protein coupled receptors family 1 profile domain-containing protein n=1 Tax=Daphnia magna TaxID=35525 RepID=A0ABQ9ZRV0_9CRUS|nr:hypothetical protein OUZ56_030625 [Daphnia magna]
MKWESNSTLELRTGELDSSLFNLSFTTDGSNSTSDPAVELDMSVIERFRSNRRVNDLAFFCLVAAYCILIIFGTIGNSLVVYVVARQPAMRTARNVFVVNLAISDLLLCLITMPLTLMEIRSYTWPLGNSPVSCKMVGSLQAVSIFVSTLSITAIALDRYQLIVYPTKRAFQLTGASLVLAAIWAICIVLALPLFIVRTLEHHDIPIPNSPVTSVDYCLEEWPNERGRSLYSIGSILVQYALPIITVSVAHARISNKLHDRMATMNHQLVRPKLCNMASSNGQSGQHSAVKESATDCRTAAREEKLRKTNTLLITISIIFTICWLPMNTFNVVEDTWNVFGDDTETMLIVYAVCHMVGMSSACANPLLYGWLNDNFRKEFHRLGTSFIAKRRNQIGGQSIQLDKTNNKRLELAVIVEREERTQEPLGTSMIGLSQTSGATVNVLSTSFNFARQSEMKAATHLDVDSTNDHVVENNSMSAHAEHPI